MIEGAENLKQSHQSRVSFMTIHDICISKMQQQDVEANNGNITYTIKIHGLKDESEEDKISDELINLQDGMSIKDLKSYILTITEDQPFFLKFHMGNEEKLQDLIERTETWNTQRGISNDQAMLIFDIYLDRENFDLHAEIDRESEMKEPINPDAGEEFKYLDVKNLNGKTTIDRFFKQIRKSLKETYQVSFKNKALAIAIKLENGEVITEEKDNSNFKVETLADHYITRFSTIKIFAKQKE